MSPIGAKASAAARIARRSRPDRPHQRPRTRAVLSSNAELSPEPRPIATGAKDQRTLSHVPRTSANERENETERGESQEGSLVHARAIERRVPDRPVSGDDREDDDHACRDESNGGHGIRPSPSDDGRDDDHRRESGPDGDAEGRDVGAEHTVGRQEQRGRGQVGERNARAEHLPDGGHDGRPVDGLGLRHREAGRERQRQRDELDKEGRPDHGNRPFAIQPQDRSPQVSGSREAGPRFHGRIIRRPVLPRPARTNRRRHRRRYEGPTPFGTLGRPGWRCGGASCPGGALLQFPPPR